MSKTYLTWRRNVCKNFVGERGRNNAVTAISMSVEDRNTSWKFSSKHIAMVRYWDSWTEKTLDEFQSFAFYSSSPFLLGSKIYELQNLIQRIWYLVCWKYVLAGMSDSNEGGSDVFIQERRHLILKILVSQANEMHFINLEVLGSPHLTYFI